MTLRRVRPGIIDVDKICALGPGLQDSGCDGHAGCARCAIVEDSAGDSRVVVHRAIRQLQAGASRRARVVHGGPSGGRIIAESAIDQLRSDASLKAMFEYCTPKV